MRPMTKDTPTVTWHALGVHLACTWRALGVYLAFTWHALGRVCAKCRVIILGSGEFWVGGIMLGQGKNFGSAQKFWVGAKILGRAENFGSR